MKNILKLFSLCLCVGYSSLAFAGDFELEHSVKVRGYYGIAETKKKASNNNMPNRLVSRTDVKLKGVYSFNDNYSLIWNNSSSAIFRQHDTRYNNDGEWRFYNWATFSSPYGLLTAGQDFNVAHKFHQGGEDSGPLSMNDTNITWFLSDYNWKNNKKYVSFQTPKSTSMMADGRALKVNYITPKVYNTLFGFTYTPDGASRRGLISRYNDYKHDDAYVFAMHNEWEFDFADVYTSAGYGVFNRTDRDISLGVTLARGGWSIAAGYNKYYIDGNENPITTVTIDPRRPAYYDNYRESQAWDFSIGYEIGPVKTSIAYLHTKADNTPNRDDLVIWSNTYAVNKMLDVYAIGGYINSKGLDRSDANNNKGYTAIMGLGINF